MTLTYISDLSDMGQFGEFLELMSGPDRASHVRWRYVTVAERKTASCRERIRYVRCAGRRRSRNPLPPPQPRFVISPRNAHDYFQRIWIT